MNPTTVCLFLQFIKPTCKPKKKATCEGAVGEHDTHCEPKSYKLKLLGQLVIQQLLQRLVPR